MSISQQVTLTNAGDVALTLIAMQVAAGDFAVVNACGNSLNAHSNCSIAVTYAPKTLGQNNGTLTVTDQFRSQTVVLNGTGVAPAGVSLSPASSLVFGATGVGVNSTAQLVTLTNNGGLPLTFTGLTVTGDFTIVPGSNTCSGTLAMGAACSLQLSFVPTTGGLRNGTLAVADDASNSPQTLALSGAGVDFVLASNGSSSVTIANGQNAVFPLLLSSSANVMGTAVLTCSGAPANSSCTVTPASGSLGGATTVSVTVNTGVAVAASSSSFKSDATLWLACLLPLGVALRRRRLQRLLLLCLLVGCGSGRHIPSDANAPGAPSPITASGTYALTVSAASAGLVRTVNLTLVIR
jgi:hypothetical protein